MNDLKMFDTFSKIQEVNLNHLGKIKFRLMNAIEKWNETSECILSDDDIESLLKQSKIADNIITNEYAQWAQLKQIEVKVKHFNFS
jgi:hypothetical protein